MAGDLARTPTTGLDIPLCGDAHLGGCGGNATPERSLVFDINDFDETLPGSWGRDHERLAVSPIVLGRDLGIRPAACRHAAMSAERSDWNATRECEGNLPFETWLATLDAKSAVEVFTVDPALLGQTFAKGRRRTHHSTLRVAIREGAIRAAGIG